MNDLSVKVTKVIFLYLKALMENSLMLTKFAVLCQQSGIVPIVAPEVLAEGTHGPEEARRVLRDVLTTLVKFLIDHHVHMAVSSEILSWAPFEN